MSDPAPYLDPDETVRVGGEEVTVRAFRFAEGLKATPIARPFIADLRAIAAGASEGEDDPESPPEAILDLIATHAEVMTELVAISTGKPADWVRALPDAEGMGLVMQFWAVNRGFFMTRLLLAGAMAKEKPQAPQPSSIPSPSPMEASPES